MNYLKNSLNLFCQKYDLSGLMGGLVFMALAITTVPVLAGGYPAGWDMPGHYYLYLRLSEYLRYLDLFVYDPYWFGGFPVFVLYPPFFYVPPALLNLLSGFFISEKLIFDFYLFLIPFFLLYSARYCLLKWYGRAPLKWFYLLSFCYFFVDIEHAHVSIGLAGFYYIGLPVASLGVALFFLMLGRLKILSETWSIRNILIVSALYALIGYTHLLSFVFSSMVFFFFFLWHRTEYKKIILCSFIALIILSPWLYQFCAYLPFSSGETIGLRHDLEGFSDPFFMLFPNLELEHFKGLLAYHGEAEILSFNVFGDYKIIIEIQPWLSYFPFIAVLCLIGTFSGIIYSFKSQHNFIPWLLILSFIFLPRDLLSHIIPFGIHYYRFAQYIFILNIIVGAYGLMRLYEMISSIKPRSINFIVRGLVLFFLFLSLINMIFLNLKWDRRNIFGRYASYNPNFKFNLEGYQDYPDIVSLIGFFKNKADIGRVAVETVGVGIFDYGSPHALISLLPIEAGVEVLPGLLAESSISSGFFNPLFAKFSKHLDWGRDNLSRDPVFQSLGSDSFLRRMKLLGVEYIVASSQELIKNLSEAKLAITREASFGSFVVFKLNNPMPKGISPNLKPFLFKNLGGTGFKEFAEDWYKYDQLLDLPVAYSGDDIANLDSELKSFQGLILSFYGNKKLSLAEYQQWHNLSTNIYFLNAMPPAEISANEKEFFYYDFHTKHADFAEHFKRQYQVGKEIPKEIVTEAMYVGKALKQLKFNSNSAMILNYNYDICWKDLSGNQVYWLTPSRIYLPDGNSGSIYCNL